MEVSLGWKERAFLRKRAQRLGVTVWLSMDSKFTERGVIGQELSKESCVVVASESHLCAKSFRLFLL